MRAAMFGIMESDYIRTARAKGVPNLSVVLKHGLRRNALLPVLTQGRLLFPAIGALSFLMVAGWHDVLPTRIQLYLPSFVIWVFLACNLILWLAGVIPIYYQPFFD